MNGGQQNALLLEVVVDGSVIADELWVGFEKTQLSRHMSSLLRGKLIALTVGIVLNSALEPNAGSPSTIFASLTGGLGSEKRALTMYGCKT